MTQDDVAHWAVHPGGEAVLTAFAREMGLPRDVLAPSWGVLHDHGNMSSASVLFVLERLLREQRPQPGERGVLCSFAALLEF
ncbi:MAG: hypothetical protein GX605_04360 [Chloroflexi bacterium]|nr:hypothetical protein [Chloroflexota bacterium]